MILKHVHFASFPAVIACDGNCAKAWGINGRPRVQLTEDLDDYVYLSDDELGTAPPPGETDTIAEGRDMKPSATHLEDGAQMNKWCARECERSVMVDEGESIELPDLKHPEPNIPRPIQ